MKFSCADRLPLKASIAYSMYPLSCKSGGGLVPSHEKLGANVTWVNGTEKWYLRLNVTNLTDEEILISAFDFSASSAYVQELYQPPLWVSLSLGVNF